MAPDKAGMSAAKLVDHTLPTEGQAVGREREALRALGPDSHPFADLARLKAIMEQREPDAGHRAWEGRGITPAALAVEAERLDLVVTFRQIRIADLDAALLPAVVMLSNGSSRLVIGRPNAERFRLATASGEIEVSRGDLAASATGAVILATSRAGVNAPASDRDGWGLALPLLGAQRGQLVHLAAAGAVVNLFGLFFPLFAMAIFDRVVPHGAFETLAALAIGILLALAFEFLVRQARLKLHDAIAQSIATAMQGQIVGRLLFSPGAAIPRSSGPILQPMQDLDAFAHSLPHLVTAIAVDIPFFLLLAGLIYAIGGPIVLVPLVAVLVLVALHIACHHFGQRAHLAAAMHLRRHSQLIIDMVSLAERIRATGAGWRLIANWETTADAAGYAAHRNRYWQGIAAQGGVVLIQAAVVATAISGAILVVGGTMTIGALSASILLMNRMLLPMSLLTGLVLRTRQLARSIAPLVALLGQPVERGGDRSRSGMAALAPRIALRNLRFTYPEEQRPSLAEISLAIAPGERIGIIGRTGSGKSTLLRLIARLHAPQDGRITIDDRDAAQIDPAAWRSLVAYMGQDNALFDTTLEDNLTIGLSGIDRARLERVAMITGVHDFASRHPMGYSMPVGPGGQRLSGGERQSVALARALIGKPALLVLDEPTAAMDNGLEARLIGALAGELGGAGLVIATHRMPMLALVDRVIWLDGGRIIADGPKADILARLGAAA